MPVQDKNSKGELWEVGLKGVKVPVYLGAWEREVWRIQWKVGEEVVLFLDILSRASLEPESREETEAK